MILQSLKITQPDDWHVHLREGEMLKVVAQYSARVNNRCIVMPNLNDPITTFKKGLEYKEKIMSTISEEFTPLIPCYLIDNLNLKDFRKALEKEIFIGAKFYPINATTNSELGISKIENIFAALEILTELNKPLLIHGEKVAENIDFFDREKFFIDTDLKKIIKNFTNLKIVLEHVSSKYGADFVNENNNIAATITPHHMMLTKNDLFIDESINPHHLCMPVVKKEKDLIALRKYACSGNKKFFLGTDSAPHHVKYKVANFSSKPGIFSAPCSIELYASIFDEEKALHKLEKFSSFNGPDFYNLPVNKKQLKLVRKKWKIPEFTLHKDIKIKNFMGGQEINWKVKK